MDEPKWLDAGEMRAWHAFLAAGALVTREVEQHLKREGLSHPQYETLVRLSDAPDGALRMTDLAEALLTSKSGLTYQVERLEKAGLVRRTAAPGDERGVVAVLTEAGRQRLSEVAPGHVATVRRALIDVLTPGQRRAVADGLGAVAERLSGR
ncbi:MarR family transcriptional regulator [Nocardia puris]|uniref:MarR family winged helix-turn-helix transcriptional regulator n=1 Tax=Nocardia puris TaxID=208602 RepID=UPI00082A9CCD|nr:MarR family transcriptional regulator [Nocardia puris]MBF6214661.1 MarR family transcriptional regulator [Nocardia puris]MBF6368865.1 MarR family transcriptional regulator [Nocardia puris]MBF6462445.1 MarR family transcriptional regulator [Nocardia puris]